MIIEFYNNQLMKESEIYNRTEYLRIRLNQFLSSISNNEVDYFSYLSTNDLVGFKMALSDVNNVLTLKTTLGLTNWLFEFFKIKEERQVEILRTIDGTKPNTNGYDIELLEERIIAEIKCIVPINDGNFYGTAQRNSILDDALKLKNGKKKISNTQDFIKIIGLLDLGQKTDDAINKLCVEPKKITTTVDFRLDRHEIVKLIKVIDQNTKLEDLTTEFIYLKKVTV